MERPCHACGAAVEDQTVFCPACGAAQIRVSVRTEAAHPIPSESESPGSPVPSPYPSLVAHPGIEWRRFLRIALAPALIGGFGLPFPRVGLLITVAMVAFTVWRYCRTSSGNLHGPQGARLGMVAGLLSFSVCAAIAGIAMATEGDEIRQSLIESMQATAAKQAANNPDLHAQVQRIIEWLGTGSGFALLIGLGLLFLLGIVLVLSAVTGAAIVSLARNRSRG